MDDFTISAFGQEYLYPSNLVIKSKRLLKAFINGNTMKLKLPKRFKPALEWIHSRMTTNQTDPFPDEYFEEIYYLADRLGFEMIFSIILAHIRQGNFSRDKLVRYYPMYYQRKYLRYAALNQIFA
jgi:hypothetical protein